jgi:hypothetical protein
VNQITDLNARDAVAAPFFIRGQVVDSLDVRHKSRDLGVDFLTPKLDLDQLITPRTEPGPLFDTPLAEIIDFLAETGQRLDPKRNVHIQECAERMAFTNVMSPQLIIGGMTHVTSFLDRRKLWEHAEQNFGDPKILDEWVPRTDSQGRRSFTRAFPPRLIHVLPGNSPSAAIQSIAFGAMVKAVNLFKMGSSDPFMAVAFLRTMLDVDPNHPVPKSLSAVYWRGGDEQVERTIYRPQYFDKIVAWGGGDAINNVIKYLMPGFQLVSFDPKTSISMIGVEAHESEESLEAAASAAANDVGILNQEACVSSRILFIEGDRAQVDRFCKRLRDRLVDHTAKVGKAPALARDIAEEVETLRMMDDEFGVWGVADGSGLVIRSDEPVDFHPIGKTANVVMVPSLKEALKYVNVATQTVGVYPPQRMPELRNGLASGGAQRVVRLGDAGGQSVGAPHDAMYPMHRFVHWIVHEDGFEGK